MKHGENNFSTHSGRENAPRFFGNYCSPRNFFPLWPRLLTPCGIDRKSCREKTSTPSRRQGDLSMFLDFYQNSPTHVITYVAEPLLETVNRLSALYYHTLSTTRSRVRQRWRVYTYIFVNMFSIITSPGGAKIYNIIDTGLYHPTGRLRAYQ